MTPLAVAIWAGVCPAYTPGEPYPVPAVVGCPVPAPGAIYPDEHADDDRRAAAALAEARIALAVASDALAEAEDAPGPWVYVGAGVVLGVAGVLLYQAGAE